VSPSNFDFSRLTRQHASKYLAKRWELKLTAGTLAAYGSRRVGPRYVLQEGRALYTPDDLDFFAQQLLAKKASKKGKPGSKKPPRKKKKSSRRSSKARGRTCSSGASL
jgi:hypothetical protein